MRKAKFAIAAMILVSSFVFGQPPQTFTFTIEGMTCSSCANTAAKVLQALEGVESAKVDFETKTSTVIGKVSEADIKAAMSTNTNFEVLFKGESLAKPLTDEERSSYDIKTIKGGRKMKFIEHLSAGNITVFDFYADWCGPCRVFSPKVDRMLPAHLTKANTPMRDV